MINIMIQSIQEFVRNVQARVEDIFHLRQIVDVKNKKIKPIQGGNLHHDTQQNIFEEVKGREFKRVNKENGMIQKLAGYSQVFSNTQSNVNPYARIEDRCMRKNIQKACKKIEKAFRIIVDEEDFKMMAFKDLYFVENELNEIMGEKLSKKAIQASGVKAKLIEASTKEKDFDAYFLMSMVVQDARNNFVKEYTKSVEIYIELNENVQANTQIRKILKHMQENHQQRSMRVSGETKQDKIYKYLEGLNYAV